MGGCLPCFSSKSSRKRQQGPFPHLQATEKVHFAPQVVSEGFFKILSSQKRSEMIDLAEKTLSKFETDEKFDRLTEARVDNLYVKETKVRFDKKEESDEYFHKYLNHEIIAFDPLVMLFCELNCDNIDSNLDQYTVFHSETTPSSILIYYLSKSKRIMMLQPRTYLVIRYIQKVSATSYIEVQQSAELMGLDSQEINEHILSNASTLASLMIFSAKAESKGSVSLRTTAVISDPKSSMGLTIAKPFLNTNNKKYSTNLMFELGEFYRLRKFEDGRKVVWFDGDYDGLVKRFEEQKKKSREMEQAIDERDELKMEVKTEPPTQN